MSRYSAPIDPRADRLSHVSNKYPVIIQSLVSHPNMQSDHTSHETRGELRERKKIKLNFSSVWNIFSHVGTYQTVFMHLCICTIYEKHIFSSDRSSCTIYEKHTFSSDRSSWNGNTYFQDCLYVYLSPSGFWLVCTSAHKTAKNEINKLSNI